MQIRRITEATPARMQALKQSARQARGIVSAVIGATMDTLRTHDGIRAQTIRGASVSLASGAVSVIGSGEISTGAIVLGGLAAYGAIANLACHMKSQTNLPDAIRRIRKG